MMLGFEKKPQNVLNLKTKVEYVEILETMLWFITKHVNMLDKVIKITKSEKVIFGIGGSFLLIICVYILK